MKLAHGILLLALMVPCEACTDDGATPCDPDTIVNYVCGEFRMNGNWTVDLTVTTEELDQVGNQLSTTTEERKNLSTRISSTACATSLLGAPALATDDHLRMDTEWVDSYGSLSIDYAYAGDCNFDTCELVGYVNTLTQGERQYFRITYVISGWTRDNRVPKRETWSLQTFSRETTHELLGAAYE